MSNVLISPWVKLPVSLAELCLDTTLRCGQSFRWKKVRDGEWCCALHGQILFLKQDPTHLHYRTNLPALRGRPLSASLGEDVDTERLVRRYFNLATNLSDLYQHWSSVDSNFNERAPKFKGVRILQQDAWEALLSFVCSSNNNIVRISQMVNNICLHYGPLVGHVDGHPLHDFPTPEALAQPGVEAHLRDLGFGYRAKYIARIAEIVAKERPKDWLESLSSAGNSDGNHEQELFPESGRPGYRKAHEALLELQGVGPKVADCVCLMGLGWLESVPVDTHVWQIATRDYKFGKGKHKTLTKITYDAVGDHFRQLWGREAGWAHSVLFAADLKTFKERLAAKSEVDAEELTVKQEEGVIVKRKLIVQGEYALNITDEVKEGVDKRKIEELTVKREDGVTVERKLIMQGEYTPNITDQVKEGVDNPKVDVENRRSQRAKRRRL